MRERENVCVCAWVFSAIVKSILSCTYVYVYRFDKKTDAAGRYFCWDDFQRTILRYIRGLKLERDGEKGIDSFRFSDFIYIFGRIVRNCMYQYRTILTVNPGLPGVTSYASVFTRSWFVLLVCDPLYHVHSIDLKARRIEKYNRGSENASIDDSRDDAV